MLLIETLADIEYENIAVCVYRDKEYSQCDPQTKNIVKSADDTIMYWNDVNNGSLIKWSELKYS